MTYHTHLLAKITTSKYWGGFFTSSIGTFMAFMVPIWPFVFMALVLVLADTVSGIRAAKKRGEKIRSRGLFRFFEKFLFYFGTIAVAEQMRITFMPQVPLTQFVSFGICITEFFSMAENVETVTGVNILRRIKKIIPGLTEEEKK